MSYELHEALLIYVAIIIAFLWTFASQPSSHFHLHQVHESDGSVSHVLESQSTMDLLANILFQFQAADTISTPSSCLAFLQRATHASGVSTLLVNGTIEVSGSFSYDLDRDERSYRS
jgi:hypothetical protein